MAGQSQGALSKLAINGQHFEFLSIDTLDSEHGLVDGSDEAIRGTLDHDKNRVTQGLTKFRHRITMQPSPAELNILLPLMAFTESTDVFTLGDTYTAFDMIIDRVAKVHTYAGSKIDMAVFRGQKGNKPLQLQIDVISLTETEANAGTFSATTIDSDIAFAFTEGVLTLQGGAEAFDRFALIINPNMQVQHNNSRNADSIFPTNRQIYLATSSPYTSDETALYTTPVGSAAGAGATLVFTRGGQSTTFTFENLKALARPPKIPGKTEIRLPLFYKAFGDGSDRPITITHDPVAA